MDSINLIKETLDWIIPTLQRESMPFHITGGFAAHLYGATRAINDIDIDLPNTLLEKISTKLSDFIELAPQRYRDSTWDVYLATYNFKGQLLDLAGSTDAYLFNKNTGEWDKLLITFNEVVWIDAYGHRLPVQNPRDLMSYKLKIGYEESKHLMDVEAIKRSVLGLRQHQSR